MSSIDAVFAGGLGVGDSAVFVAVVVKPLRAEAWKWSIVKNGFEMGEICGVVGGAVNNICRFYLIYSTFLSSPIGHSLHADLPTLIATSINNLFTLSYSKKSDKIRL